jgi:multicomponent Na+:H+ antiporter subunit E
VRIEIRSRIAVFIISLLIWLLITSFTDLQEIVAGIIVAALVTLVSGDLLAPGKVKIGISTIYHIITYVIIFVWEIFKANLHVAYIVIHPKLPINPGIIKIKTKLTNDVALTILANSITLTPGTLTIDIDKPNGFVYIHCIEVPDHRDIDGNSATIADKYEKRLEEIFK